MTNLVSSAPEDGENARSSQARKAALLVQLKACQAEADKLSLTMAGIHLDQAINALGADDAPSG